MHEFFFKFFLLLGPYKLDVAYDSVPVPGTPFNIKSKQGNDPKRCKAYGPGLERGVVNQPNIFTIDTLGAGPGGIGLGIEGPSEAEMICKDNKDGTCTAEYIPDEGGDYDITVKFAGEHIPG